MNNTERMQVLRMVEDGQVSIEDAIGLMSSPEKPSPLPKPTNGGRWLRVRVTDLETGKRKVSVNVPLKLMKWGMKIGARFTPELEGMDMDMDDLLADLDQYVEGPLVEVEDDSEGQRVEVFIE